jgi:hypothetical protein
VPHSGYSLVLGLFSVLQNLTGTMEFK